MIRGHETEKVVEKIREWCAEHFDQSDAAELLIELLQAIEKDKTT
jgi:hypothetical protein